MPDVSIYNIQMHFEVIRNRWTTKHTQLDINIILHSYFLILSSFGGKKMLNILIYNIQMHLKLIRNCQTTKHIQLNINMSFHMATF